MSHSYPNPESASAQPHGASGRLRADSLDPWERTYSLFMHLGPFAGLVFAPLYFGTLVMWLIKRDESAFIDDHGREALNFQISFILLHLILIPISILTLGLGVLLYPTLWIVAVIAVIRGAIASGNGEYFRYPVTFRLIS